MGVIASGISKLLTFKKQTGLGVQATAPAGQNLRRTMSTLDKKKATYASKEIRPSQQRADFRHGVVMVDGTISGELSVGTYQAFTESICRQLSLVPVSVSGLLDIVSASTGTNTGTLTTTAGSFMNGSNKFKIGYVVRCTGFTTTATANNSANMIITAMTDKVLTVARLDAAAIVAKTETGSVTIAMPGKYTYVAQSGQTRDYYTIEHNFADIAQSEVFTDCVVTQVDIKLPASGMAAIDFVMKGLNMVPSAGPGYFTAPSAVTSGSVLAAANGVVYIGANPVALITGANISIKGNHSMIGGVVGSNAEPDIFPGDVVVDGQITVLFQDNVIRDIFLQETEVAVYLAFTTNNTPTADFVSYIMPRVKLGGAMKDDGEKGLVMTMPFTALENVAGGPGVSSLPTTIAIQDSAFV